MAAMHLYRDAALSLSDVDTDDEYERQFSCNVSKYIRLKQQSSFMKCSGKKNAVPHLTRKNAIQTINEKHIKQQIKLAKEARAKFGNTNSDSIYRTSTSNYFADNDENEFDNITRCNDIAELSESSTYEEVWAEIREHLEELKENGNMEGFAIGYTKILMLHVYNEVPFDHMCLIGLVSCIKPLCIEELFDLGLIDEETKLQCLFKPGIYEN